MNLYLELVIYSNIIILGAFIVFWATETAQVLISQGLVLTILVWVQMLPEFAVEAGLAHSAGRNVENIKLIGANFTGSIRLLGGFAIPLIFFVRIIILKQYRGILRYRLMLPRFHGISVIANFLPTLVFSAVLFKQTISIFDSVILVFIYVIYLWYLRKTPPVEEESEKEMEIVPRNITKIEPLYIRWSVIVFLFFISAIIFYKVTDPFIDSCKKIAITLLVSEFVFIQWIAPFLTEFPEGLTIFFWAKSQKKASTSLLNILSANISQWTILPAMILVVYFLSGGRTYYINLNAAQLIEIALTMSQTIFLTTLLVSRRLIFLDAAILLLLWLLQFFIPTLRMSLIFVYLGLSLMKIVTLIVQKSTTKLIIDVIMLAKR